MSLSKLNPDWLAAEIHGHSTRPGLVKSDAPTSEQLICPCCHNVIEKIEAPLCQNSKQLQFLGFGFPLFYVFIKYCIILLLVNISSYNAITLFWSINSGYQVCSKLEHGCTSIMVQLADIGPVVTNQEIIVRIFSFVIQFGSLVYIRDLIIKTRNYYNERTCSISDYSMIMHNLPKRKGTKKNLQRFLKQCFQSKLQQVTFLPQNQDFYQIEEKCSQITKNIKVIMNLPQSQQTKQKLEHLQNSLAKWQQKLQEYCVNELKSQQNDECVAEKVIFCCQNQDVKDAIIEGFDQVSQQKLRQIFQILPNEQCLIRVEIAPEPRQISWEHINYPQHKRLIRMIIGWLLTVLFLAVITSIFFFILSQKSHLIEKSIADSHGDTGILRTAIFIVYLAIISVIFFNKFVMGFVLHKISDFQMHETNAQEEFHFALKYAVGMFFTTALMTLAVQDIKYLNFYEHPYGVIQEETVMFAMNAFFVPLIWLINPWQIHVLARRKLNYGRKDLTQRQANKIMENVQYNMGKRYAQIIQIMWFTFLYSSLIPIGGFLSVIGLSLYYWVDKYNLLRRSSVNSNIAGELPIYAMKLLDFTLMCKPLGQIIFDSQMRDSYCLTSLIMAGIGLLYLLLPVNQFLNHFHNQKFKNQQKTFAQVFASFPETYETLHPIYSLKKQNQDRLQAAIKRLEQKIKIQKSVQVVLQPPAKPSKFGQNAKQMKKLVKQSIYPTSSNQNTFVLKPIQKKQEFDYFKETQLKQLKQIDS